MVKAAFFTPLPPLKSGIAVWAEELLPSLAESIDIDIFVDGFKPISATLNDKFIIRDITEFDILKDKYDISVYQIGNNLQHVNIYDYAIKYPGVLIMHDFCIHGMLAGKYLDLLKDNGLYYNELWYNYGNDTAETAKQRIQEGKLGLWETDPMNYPLNFRILLKSKGAVVLSDFAKGCIEEYGLPLPVLRIYHHGKDIKKISAEDVRKSKIKLGFNPDEVLIGSFGFINYTKRPYSIIEAFENVLKSGKKASLVFVGELMDNCTDIPGLIEEKGLGDNVRLVGFADENIFTEYIKACDVCLSLRYPTMGETSGVLIKSISMGKPNVITSIGTFQEVPDTAAIKISHDETEVIELTNAINKLISDKDYFKAVSENAFNYAETHFDIKDVAINLAGFINQAGSFARLSKNKVYINTKERLAKHINEIDLQLSSVLAADLTNSMADIFACNP